MIQIATIEKILRKKGKIDNFTTIDKRITTRLSHYIHQLRKRGWVFQGGYVGKTRNYQYKVVTSPIK